MSTKPHDRLFEENEMAEPAGDYRVLDGLKVWWNPSDPERIHLATDRSDIVDDNGEKPGLRIVFSNNPRSADYSPGNFNRISRWLAAEEKSSPSLVEPSSRLLRDRT